MSIAMTVVVAPSRRLRCLLGGFGACLFAAACAVGLDASAGFAAGAAVAAALLFAGLCALHVALRPAMVHRIDISGVGKLRLTVQQGVGQDAGEALAVRVLPGSTLWPRLLVLGLETVGDEHGGGGGPAGGTRALPGAGRRTGWGWRAGGRSAYRVAVLPDSLPPEDFRVLAVALGASAAEGGASPATYKIL